MIGIRIAKNPLASLAREVYCAAQKSVGVNPLKQPLPDIIVTVECRVCHGGYEARRDSIAAQEKICTPCWEYEDIAVAVA